MVDHAEEVADLVHVGLAVLREGASPGDGVEAHDRFGQAARLVVQEAEPELAGNVAGIEADQLLERVDRGVAVAGLFVELAEALERGRIARLQLELAAQRLDLALGVAAPA